MKIKQVLKEISQIKDKPHAPDCVVIPLIAGVDDCYHIYWFSMNKEKTAELADLVKQGKKVRFQILVEE